MVRIDNLTRQAIIRDRLINSFTHEELGVKYGYSRSTISRLLADEGHNNLANYKTPMEHSMLEILYQRGVHNVTDLVNALK